MPPVAAPVKKTTKISDLIKDPVPQRAQAFAGQMEQSQMTNDAAQQQAQMSAGQEGTSPVSEDTVRQSSVVQVPGQPETSSSLASDGKDQRSSAADSAVGFPRGTSTNSEADSAANPTVNPSSDSAKDAEADAVAHSTVDSSSGSEKDAAADAVAHSTVDSSSGSVKDSSMDAAADSAVNSRSSSEADSVAHSTVDSSSGSVNDSSMDAAVDSAVNSMSGSEVDSGANASKDTSSSSGEEEAPVDDKFKVAWETMFELLFREIATIYYPLKGVVPKIHHNVIQVKVKNEMMKDNFESRVRLALEYLRNNYDPRIDDIKVEIENNPEQSTKLIYDIQDKLNDLRKENPDLPEFLKILNLSAKDI